MINIMANETLGYKKIRIGWFASGFVGRPASGTAYVARRVVEHLITRRSDKFEIILFTKNELESSQAHLDSILKSATIVELPAVKGSFMNGSRQFYKYCKNSEIIVDFLIFSVARVYPFFWKFPAKKFICIFHAAGDVTVKADKFVLSKHIYNYVNKLQWKYFDAIIAVSEFARREIIENYGVAAAAIRIIPPGVDSFKQESISRPNSIKSNKPIVAVMGRWQTFKNVGFTCKILRELRKNSSIDFHIVLVGRSNVKGRENVENEIKLHSKQSITVIEYLEPSELVWLYQNAKLTIVPSLNEGFGMPSFEAYASGATLLVHSKTPAASMLKNESGVYSCNMEDFAESFSQIKFILENYAPVDIISRSNFISNRKLTWEDFGEKYVELILEQTLY